MTDRKSSMDAQTNQKRNTKGRRKQMSSSNFAIPEERKYRLDDLAHARNALARVAQHGTESEKRRVRLAVYRKYPSLNRGRERG